MVHTFGIGEWLKKLTTVTKASVGVIELGLSRTINLFYAKWGCPGETYFGELSMDLEADLSMDATYAYYLSATFIPPGKPETFAYFGMELGAYIGLHVEGRVIAQTQTERKKIIDNLTYPGLAMKGIAAVGPTLDIYGQPQDNDLQAKYSTLLGLESKTESPAPGTVEPVFHAGVAVDTQIDILITPQASIGIKIGGGKIVTGKTLMDVQLSGYVDTDLSFQAHSDYDTSDDAFHYRFGAYLYYNIGYKAVAKILSYIDWATGDRKAYWPDKMLKLYEKTVAGAQRHENEADLSGNSTMSVLEPAADIFRRADITTLNPKTPMFTKKSHCPAGASGFQLPELRFNCGFLGPYQGVNEIRDADNDLTETLTYDVPGLCDNIVSLMPLRSKFTFAQHEKWNLLTKRRYGDNKKLSWAFKRDYETSWINAQTPLTPADWSNANPPTWDKPNYEGPLTMDSVLCAINHFNQDDVYKLPGVKVESDGKPIGKQKEYNALCKRTKGSGIRHAEAWGIDYVMARCLIRFQNSASGSSSTSKRDTQEWDAWKVESIEYVEDMNNADMAQLLGPASLDGYEGKGNLP
ncbi:hypothetical protein PEX1_029170 [Penicillium expansum]|uniref:Uncharacterized protein n=1 Tax=Penicillium expansum TaxID=27334 RepID=A0A0A2I304_PENEN|nr:hypothetical protein PEX2_008290 [Penicillium expansum]KGO37509.1 hypothetical protein PEXP_076750 [Penicillium expansum]KGO47438.1 hypothetical protein PEX1_029170 [Penicillium expansum]KGO51712.1 hypothetical protein PEX2_008290 [Penicillium expansum]